jgi:hypothetical protein
MSNLKRSVCLFIACVLLVAISTLSLPACLSKDQTGATSGQKFTLSGKCYFDYNGNGGQEDSEPDLTGVNVNIGSRQGKDWPWRPIYRDLSNNDGLSYWTKDNDPQFSPQYSE